MQTLIFLIFLTPNNPHSEPMQSWNQCTTVRDAVYETAKETGRTSIFEKELYCFNYNTKKKSFYGEN